MELYAAGFNAWNQLNFQERQPAEPNDLHVFECVLKADKISVRAYLTCTVGLYMSLCLVGSS